MIILAFDPSTVALGIAVVKYDGARWELLCGEVVRWKAGRMNAKDIYDAMRALDAEFGVDLVAVEEVNVERNLRTTRALWLVAGAIWGLACEWGIPFIAVNNQSAKAAIGAPGGSKEQVIRAAQNFFRRRDIADEHIADACAVAVAVGKGGEKKE